MWHFGRQVLDVAGSQDTPPSELMWSRKGLRLSLGPNLLSPCRFWPVRKYPWGSCEALSSLHSDLSALKKLLFEVMYEEFKQLTEQRYYKFRQNTLFNLDDPNRCRLSLFPQESEFCIVCDCDCGVLVINKRLPPTL